MPDELAKKKWNEIYAENISTNMQPAHVLSEYSYLLPKSGKALDIACGLGANTIFLAQHSLQVHAWDISEQAIEKLKKSFTEQYKNIKAVVRDVHEHPPAKDSYNVICVSYFLERSISENIISALKPNGLLFYQTFIRENVTLQGPKNPDYRLNNNELLTMFSPPLHVLVYQELGCVGDITHGVRDVAFLVAQNRRYDN